MNATQSPKMAIIVCFISTSSSKTAGENPGAGKLAKIRADAFWAGSLSEKPQEIMFAFTDKSMVEFIKQEKDNGRFPKHIKNAFGQVAGEIK